MDWGVRSVEVERGVLGIGKIGCVPGPRPSMDVMYSPYGDPRRGDFKLRR